MKRGSPGNHRGARLTIEEVVVPASVEGPDAGAFLDYVRVRNEVETDVLGTALLSPTARQARPEFADNANRVRRLFMARLDGVPVGSAMTTVRVHDLDAGAHLVANVVPDARGSGIGNALFEAATDAAHAAGCSLLKVNTPHTATPGGDRIASSTGFGDVSAGDPGARFLLSRGFALEQVNRISMLQTAGLDVTTVPFLEDAAGVAGHDYALHRWDGLTPQRWRDDLAELRTRMSTDAPSGGLDVRLDPWDVERVVDHDRRVGEGGQVAVTIAAEHVATGRLVGFTELIVPFDGVVAVQEDTLVLAEHRGRRLGVLLKATAGQSLALAHPQVEQIVTWNAEENRPMLDVNELLGFAPVGYEGTWQLRPRS